MDNYLVADSRRYEFQSAAWIAQEHATGATLLELHQAHPDNVPSPMVVKRWRREFPAFDLLMIEAEHARADVLVDQTFDIADSDDRTAGAARNSIQARQWAAARMHRDRWAQTKTLEVVTPQERTGKRELMSVYSDEDLQEIIRAGLKESSIEGEVVDQKATPGAPPLAANDPPEVEAGSDTPTPKIFAEKPSELSRDIVTPAPRDAMSSYGDHVSAEKSSEAAGADSMGHAADNSWKAEEQIGTSDEEQYYEQEPEF